MWKDIHILKVNDLLTDQILELFNQWIEILLVNLGSCSSEDDLKKSRSFIILLDRKLIPIIISLEK